MRTFYAWDQEEAAKIRQDGQMLKWLRRQVNTDLRAAYAGRRMGLPGAGDRIAHCQALREMLRFADNWHETAAKEEYRTISTSRTLVLAVMWKFAKAYRTRPGWRQDWDRRTP